MCIPAPATTLRLPRGHLLRRLPAPSARAALDLGRHPVLRGTGRAAEHRAAARPRLPRRLRARLRPEDGLQRHRQAARGRADPHHRGREPGLRRALSVRRRPGLPRGARPRPRARHRPVPPAAGGLRGRARGRGRDRALARLGRRAHGRLRPAAGDLGGAGAADHQRRRRRAQARLAPVLVRAHRVHGPLGVLEPEHPHAADHLRQGRRGRGRGDGVAGPGRLRRRPVGGLQPGRPGPAAATWCG